MTQHPEKIGYLIGEWIGKNGIEALDCMRIKQALAPVKEVLLSKQTQPIGSLKGIKAHKIEIPSNISSPCSSIVGAIPVYPKDCWVMPYQTGHAVIGTQFYPDHALTRFAPQTCEQIHQLLEDQISKTTKELERDIFKMNAFEKIKNKKIFKADLAEKRIYPLLVEPQIVNPRTCDVKVYLEGVLKF